VYPYVDAVVDLVVFVDADVVAGVSVHVHANGHDSVSDYV